MRLIAVLVLLSISSAFAAFQAPPVSNVSSDNLDFAPSLDSSFDPSAAFGGQLLVRFAQHNQTLPLNASLGIAGMSVMVDNSTYPVTHLSAILRRGTVLGHLTSLPSSGSNDFACNLNWFQRITQDTAWRCDFDGDGCAKYENSSSASYDLNATFAFRNVTDTVPVGPNVVEVPDDLLAAMAGSSGNETLNVSVSGFAIFSYRIDRRFFISGTTCGDNFTNYTVEVPVSASRNFTVWGTGKLFFLRTPILREQWIMSNSFDTVVLSQSPLSHFAVILNNATVSDSSLRTFDIFTDAAGLEEINSTKTALANRTEKVNITTPIPLEAGNSSFMYEYDIRYDYPGSAAGESNVSLIVNDSFGGKGNFSDTLVSRYLSYNGTTSEMRTPISSQPTRGSGTFAPDTLAHVEIGLGLVAFVLILAFVNFWLT